MILESLRARTIVRAIADAAQRWTDADFPLRVRACERIVDRTGYSLPVVEFALDQLFGGVTEAALLSTIDDELGSLRALDGFTDRVGRPAAWARPIGKVCIIASRTTVGVALPAALFALCAKCDVVVRDREDALCAAFFETLAEERSEFAEAAQAGGSHEDFPLHGFAAVVAFGRDGTLRKIRNGLAVDARFIPFGSRASAGYVTRETQRDQAAAGYAARGAARDLLLYESEGCLSLHVLFVERDDRTASFCELLRKAVRERTVEFPPGRHTVFAQAAVAQARAAAAFRAANAGSITLPMDEDAAIIFDPPDRPPDFLPRTLGVIPVNEPRDALDYVARHAIALEAFAVSSQRDDVVRSACETGAVRIALLGELQRPPLGGHHGGRLRIAEFVRWIDLPA